MERYSKDELLFVEEVPEQMEIECPVCFNILTDPHQVSCCGNNVCESCIEGIKESNGSCPRCMEQEYDSSINKNVSRIINGLQVYCTNMGEGCQWKGELKELSTHLNKGKREGECQYEEVKCRYDECQARGQRQLLNVHEKECFQQPQNYDHFASVHLHTFITEAYLESCLKNMSPNTKKGENTRMPFYLDVINCDP
ncbi:PREDICTED: TNF receptor-associated factor 3-like, partial [Amphimedon queenslandica]|uniref:RING-type domain-containing protein n=2 Tax=Amphimedon queenslandica TaxID=400682 RepID=A0AAN0IR26_AMPQE